VQTRAYFSVSFPHPPIDPFAHFCMRKTQKELKQTRELAYAKASVLQWFTIRWLKTRVSKICATFEVYSLGIGLSF